MHPAAPARASYPIKAADTIFTHRQRHETVGCPGRASSVRNLGGYWVGLVAKCPPLVAIACRSRLAVDCRECARGPPAAQPGAPGRRRPKTRKTAGRGRQTPRNTTGGGGARHGGIQ
eukprot:2307103-Prymnesium_polylepis.1